MNNEGTTGGARTPCLFFYLPSYSGNNAGRFLKAERGGLVRVDEKRRAASRVVSNANLKPFRRGETWTREAGRRGGIASGVSRRKHKVKRDAMRKVCKWIDNVMNRALIDVDIDFTGLDLLCE